MVINNKQYCRPNTDLNIYVNSNSKLEIELGTRDYPYKSIDQAFMEVWNFWTDFTSYANINVMENTTNYIWYQ